MKNKKPTEKRIDFIKRKAILLLNSSKNKNPFELAKSYGVHVVRRPLAKETPGFIADNIIYVDINLDAYSQKIVCAHELGHYMLHKDMNELYDADSNTYTEFEANLFIALLMPQVFSKIDIESLKSITDFNKYIERQINYSSTK